MFIASSGLSSSTSLVLMHETELERAASANKGKQLPILPVETNDIKSDSMYGEVALDH
jgi:hypothetical protein